MTPPATARAPRRPPGETSGHDVVAAGAEKHHVEPLSVTKFTVTNTLLSAWFATLVLILFFLLGARKKSLVPGRFQGLIEILVEGAYSSCSGVLGPELARKAFPVIATIFFFRFVQRLAGIASFLSILGVRSGRGDKSPPAPVGGHRSQHALGPGPDFIRPLWNTGDFGCTGPATSRNSSPWATCSGYGLRA